VASDRRFVRCHQRGGRLGFDRPRFSDGSGRSNRGLVCEQAAATWGSGHVAGTRCCARCRCV